MTDKKRLALANALDAIAQIKSMSTIRIWERLENYLRGQFWKERTFWSDGYFACSVGDASADTIRRYIEEQG